MQRHESYKPSGVKWIGDVPAHWDVRPGFTCFDENKDRNKNLTEKTVLSLSYGRIVVKPDEKMTGLVPESFDTYQLIKPGDIVIRTTDLQNDKTSLRVGLARDKGIITSAYLGLRCKPEINPEYVFRLLESYDALKVFYGMGSGLRQNIDFWDFKRLPIPTPPRIEQDRIVTFLDQKNAEIDAAIAKKERLIELLHEQKSALIKQAVTRGLNPLAQMRESGVDWIGDFPAHWRISSLSHQAVIFAGGTPDRSVPRYWGGEIPWIKTGEVNFNRISSAEEHITDAGLRNSAAKIAPAGTLLMAMYGQGVTRGRVAILDVPAAFNQACVAMKFWHNISTEFAFFYFYGAYSFLRDSGNESSQMNLSSGAISKFKITIPPMHEQDEICKHLRNALEMVNAAERAQRETVDKLYAMKQSLITDVVTGKIRA
ncbi:MAG TPA: restriction endonuclease subunit S [Burkholderiaceae bacterium]|nr:restriction endonuclease subunit S [Burkholderiaceae bacterium]